MIYFFIISILLNYIYKLHYVLTQWTKQKDFELFSLASHDIYITPSQNLSRVSLFRKETKELITQKKFSDTIRIKVKTLGIFLQLNVPTSDRIFMIIKTTVFENCSFYENKLCSIKVGICKRDFKSSNDKPRICNFFQSVFLCKLWCLHSKKR